MIKSVILSLICFGYAAYLSAQRYDNIWLYGNENRYATPVNIAGGGVGSFNTRPPTFSRARKPMDFARFTSSMCDSNGILQFYSNGLRIANRNDQIMENGDSIGFGNGNAWRFWSTNPGYLGSIWVKAGFSIPWPNQADKYMFFYSAPNTNVTLDTTYNITNYVSVIDMGYNNSLGKVILKNQPLMTDSFGFPNACKHANGRDWWVVFPHASHHKLMTYLVTPDGVGPPQMQTIANRTSLYYLVNSSVFSPDGSRYAIGSDNGFIRIYQFDRCDGTFTLEREIATDPLYRIRDLVFSENNRFLYEFDSFHAVQIDISDPNSVTRDTVAIGNNSLFINYSICNLMPDGKIYCVALNGLRNIHVMHAPDSAGVACRFQDNAIISPVNHYGSMPYFPNYRLGPLRGSGCDTLTSLSPPTPDPKVEVKVYPNPTSGLVNFEVPEGLELTELRVYDTLGRLVLRKQEGIGTSLDISALPKSIYFLELRNEGNEVMKRVKIIKN